MAKDNIGETGIKGLRFGDKKQEEIAKETIAKAIGKSVVESGASSLPESGFVPEAVSHGPVPSGPIQNTGDASIYLGQGAEIARHMDLAANPACQALDPMQVVLSKQLASAMAQQAPAQPAIPVNHGGFQRIVPASLTSVPHMLHMNNSPQAKALWAAFCGQYRQQLAQLAAKAGFPSMPFVYLTQALYALLEFDNFFPKKSESMAKFDRRDREPQSDFYRALVTWAGPDLTHILLQTAERAGISVMEALGQMFELLEQRRKELVGAAARYQTQYEWGAEGSEEIGAE